MLPTPQELSQVVDQSRLLALDRLIEALPPAAVVLILAAVVAVSWMCWTEGHSRVPHIRHRRV